MDSLVGKDFEVLDGKFCLLLQKHSEARLLTVEFHLSKPLSTDLRGLGVWHKILRGLFRWAFSENIYKIITQMI